MDAQEQSVTAQAGQRNGIRDQSWFRVGEEEQS